MQDLKIEYRDGKLIELSIDGVSFNDLTSITFSHEAGKSLPTVSLTMPLGVGDRLVSASQPRPPKPADHRKMRFILVCGGDGRGGRVKL
ncbi:hypothetical protein [Pseudescherichia vulneris]|uniref:hypothetical protein n=1 Tax=Pseudescherichia vulneris TaxID=566 RepID=UPI001FB62261|nr:hypothetical protein [Pseudescherichia vulneris]